MVKNLQCKFRAREEFAVFRDSYPPNVDKYADRMWNYRPHKMPGYAHYKLCVAGKIYHTCFATSQMLRSFTSHMSFVILKMRSSKNRWLVTHKCLFKEKHHYNTIQPVLRDCHFD